MFLKGNLSRRRQNICFEEYKEANSDIYKYLSVKAYVEDVSPAVLSVAILDNLESHVRFQGNSNIYYELNIDSMDSLVGITTSMSDAEATAERLLLDLGITDTELEGTKVKVEIKPTDDLETISTLAGDPYREKCFEFHFSRVYKGIPVTIAEPCYGMESENSGNEEYDRPWASEEIIVSVDDNGVIAFQWDSPGDIIRTVNDNVRLMEFDDIKETFKKQIFYQRTWTFPGIQENRIIVKTIKQGYMRIRVKDENKYYILPVWDFIGDWTYTVRSQKTNIENVSFLTLNALDSSVISRYLGY